MLSLVIPILNEEKLIGELSKRTIAAIESFTDDYEVIFVDDGCSDRSPEMILELRNNNPKIKLLSLSKNFGHQAAFTAGLEYSKGDIVAMMDGDLQDPPELIAEMYNKIVNEGFDIVSGKKIARKGNKGRNLFTALFHLIFRKIADIRNMENFGNYSMMKRIAVDALLSMREKVRYLPGLRSFIGFNHGYIEFIRDERFKGKPKMNIRRLFILASDAIFSFSRFPIYFCLIIGSIGTLVFLTAGIYMLITHALESNSPGWSPVLLSIYFLGSIQLVFLGILGEYIFRNYKEAQNRPIYFVKKFYGDDAKG